MAELPDDFFDGTGKIRPWYLPAMAITSVLVVDSLDDDKLSPLDEGDVAVLPDGSAYIYDGERWLELKVR